MICRLSVSSFFSPGPLVPIPPPRRDSDFPKPVRRGILYCSCASSTCSFPSFDAALSANMSRISIVLSMTLTPVASSRFLSCTPESSSLNITVSTSIASHISASSATFPLPISVAVSGFSRACTIMPATSIPSASASPASSSIEYDISLSSCIPTRTALYSSVIISFLSLNLSMFLYYHIFIILLHLKYHL